MEEYTSLPTGSFIDLDQSLQLKVAGGGIKIKWFKVCLKTNHVYFHELVQHNTFRG